jgi:hypothetical protein
MDFDQDRMLLARAELSDLAEALRLTHFNSNPVLFLTRLEAIRETSKKYRFESVAEIASAYEDAMQRAISRSSSCEAVIGGYNEIMSDAIGCERLDSAVAQSLLAMMSVRLRA